MIPAYRCASCGSPNVVKDTQTGGVKYNYLKGAIGTVALGIGGAVAGITSDTQEVFKCPDCGLTLTFSLEEPWKSLIDIGNSSEEARKTLNLNGSPIKWDFLKGKYPNIEEGQADKEIKQRQEFEKEQAENTKNSSSDLISRVRGRVQDLPIYRNIKAGKYIVGAELFAHALCITLEESGGSWYVGDEGRELLTILSEATGYDAFSKVMPGSNTALKIGRLVYTVNTKFGRKISSRSDGSAKIYTLEH